MAGACKEEPREFLKRNPLVQFGSYHYWTPRECLRCPPCVSEAGVYFLEGGSAPSRRSRFRLQNIEHLVTFTFTIH